MIKNGFRRIGRTAFFGFHPSPFHPSRRLPIEADSAAPEDEFDDLVHDDDLDEDNAKKKYPIHYAICHDQSSRVGLTIRSEYTRDPTSIHKRDTAGFSPIYVAAEKGHVHAVRTLLDLGALSDVMDDHNRAGLNAVEKVEVVMRTTREFSEAMLGTWDGYPGEPLRCEFLLKRAVGLPTLSDTEDGYVTKRKWGCTCSTCADRWLSPRMRFRLKSTCGAEATWILYIDSWMAEEAKAISDEMKKEHDTNPYFSDDGPVDVDSIADLSSMYLPHGVRGSMTKTFYRGYQRIFTAIHNHLHTAKEALTGDKLAIATALDRDVMAYLRGGGRYEYALDALTGVALEHSIYGDGSFEEQWEGGDENKETEYTRLRTCVNDLEFGMVRERLGLNRESAWGPYGLVEDDDDNGGDSDGDDEEDY